MSMRALFRIGVAAMVIAIGASRPAYAAPYQLCLELDTPGARAFPVYLSFNVQGTSILVSGEHGIVVADDHGPVFGGMSRPPIGFPGRDWEIGVTIVYENSGDYLGPNAEFVVYRFHPDGSITYKRSHNA